MCSLLPVQIKELDAKVQEWNINSISKKQSRWNSKAEGGDGLDTTETRRKMIGKSCKNYEKPTNKTMSIRKKQRFGRNQQRW